MKYLSFVLIVIILLSITVSCKDPGRDTQKENPIRKVNPEQGPIELIVSSTGRVISNLDVEIKCKASGEIISLPFDISGQVKKGDLVVELDPVDENRNVEKATVSLQSSKAVLQKAKTNLQIAQTEFNNDKKTTKINYDLAKIRAEDARAKADRIKELLGKKLSAYEEYETAQTTLAKAEADLENAQIQLDALKVQEESLNLKKQDLTLAESDYRSTEINLSIAEQRLKDTKVYSPIDGVVTARNVQTGQIISSGISNVGGGTSVMTISDLSRLFVVASVDESDIGNIGTGQKVAITADAFSGKQFDGLVERIAQKGDNQSNVVTFEVRIEVISENKNMLKPEMTANVDIIIAKKESVLHIPGDALYRVKGKYYVTVESKDGKEEEREIQIGIDNGEIVEVTGGLTETDTLIVKGSSSQSEWGRPPTVMRMMGPPRGGGRR
jgi:HlyD family secretion protein